MFIIYNVSGLLIGLLGIAAGVMAIGVTSSPGVGLCMLALTWAVLGVIWKLQKTSTGQSRPAPSLFFIPLYFWAIPVLFLGMVMGLAEIVSGPRVVDPRAASFSAEEKKLRSGAATGDSEVAHSIMNALQALANPDIKAERFGVHAVKQGEAGMVLLEAPNLKKFSDNARKELVTVVRALAQEQWGDSVKNVYVGVKGRLMWGAVSPSKDQVRVGSVVPEEPLLDFYGPKPKPEPVEPAK